MILISIAVVAGSSIYALSNQILSVPNKLEIKIIDSSLIKIENEDKELCFLTFELTNSGNLEVLDMDIVVTNSSGKEVNFEITPEILNSLNPGNLTIIQNPSYIDPENSTKIIDFESENYCKIWRHPDCQTYPIRVLVEGDRSDYVTQSILECKKPKELR